MAKSRVRAGIERRLGKRIRESGEPLLADFVELALRRPLPIASTLIDLLNDQAFLVLERALGEVLGERN